MKAIGKNIVVKNVDEDIKTASGLVLTGEDTNQLRYKRGIVVEPGTDVLTLQQGDDIYYDKAHGYTMIIHDIQYSIIQERDVVIVL